MRHKVKFLVLAGFFFASIIPAAERINHAGRILGPTLEVTNVVLFNTPEADEIMSTLQIFPRNHAWNEDISRRPLLVNSDAMIASIFDELFATGSSNPKLRVFQEMNFVLVPDEEPLSPIRFVIYPEESDPSPYPIPAELPIEGWPSQTGDLTLHQVQRDASGDGGDRHAIIIQPGTGFVWETWQTLLTDQAVAWQAANGAKFDLNSNRSRPDGWTSADAAGLSMLGGLVRFDECERGEIEHALRMIVKHTRREYIYPATHHASSPSTTDPNVPAMGQRLRLKADFTAPADWTKQEKAIVAALQKYGGIIADNSSRFFSISVVPDQRWPSGAFANLNGLSITDFEVIQTTGAAEGPRSAGAPTAQAGSDQSILLGAVAKLAGTVEYADDVPEIRWRLYSGPEPVVFEDASRTETTAAFGVAGEYVLMLSADDGIHTPAYDALVVTVREEIHLSIARAGEDVRLEWMGGKPPFEVQSTSGLPAIEWLPVGTSSSNVVIVPVDSSAVVFRVVGQ